MIEAGSRTDRWPRIVPPKLPAGVAVAALLAGLALGFLGGHLQAGVTGTTAATTGTTSRQDVSPAITATGRWCAVQYGGSLQLGIEILDQSRRAVTLSAVRAVLPLGGMIATASEWGPCGAPPAAGQDQGAGLAPGSTGWLAVTFDVIVRCPAALPVGFRVSYAQPGRSATAEFPSFPDLGQVPYAGCPAPQ